MFGFRKYQRVYQDEPGSGSYEDEKHEIEDNDVSTGTRIFKIWRRKMRLNYCIKHQLYCFLILILVATNIITLGIWSASSYAQKLPSYNSLLDLDTFRNKRPKVEILGPADIPVEMEMRQFYTGIRDDRRTEFMGRPNKENNAAWQSILDVNLIRLNEQQANLLGDPTAEEYQAPPGSYVGVLEVFHQLHCLNRLRMAFYTGHTGESGESDEQIQRHNDHCFEYLRQSLMCLSDVNIGPVGFNDTTLTYVAEGDGVKECRNFEKIHTWAKAHDAPNAPGNELPGMHHHLV